MTTKLNLTLGAIGLLAAGSVFGATTWVLNTGTVTVSSVSVTSTGWADTGTNANQSGGPLQLQPANSNVVLYSGGLGINNLDGCSKKLVDCLGAAGLARAASSAAALVLVNWRCKSATMSRV